MDLKEYNDESDLKMVVPIKELLFEELTHLVDFLRGKNPEESEEKKNENLFRRISLFFPTLDAVQEVKFFSILSAIIAKQNEAKPLFENFKLAYPELPVYRDGSGVPVKKNYWTIRLDSLEQMYLAVSKKENPTAEEKNIIEAKTLDNIKDVKPTASYYITKKIYLRTVNNNEINENILKNLEILLESMGISLNILNKFLTKYMRRNWGSIRTWFKHFESRVDILFLDYKKNSGQPENSVNKEFLETLKRVCE